MAENSYSVNQYVAALRRRKWHLLGAGALVFAISAAVTLSLPSVYRSTATILVEQQEIPQDLVRSTVSTYADQRIQVIGQRVLTRANLTEILRRYDLYAEQRESEPIEATLNRMVEDIAVENVSADVVDPRSGKPTQVTIAFTVSYENTSPAVAQQVASDLVALYLNENVRSRTEQVKETSGFIEREAGKLQKTIAELEAKLAVFKEKNADSLPELAQLNLQLIDKTERELSDVERQIRALEERRVYLGAELAKTNTALPVYGENGRPVMSPSDRLQLMKAEYLSMAAVYAPEHPDVMRLRREIAALEADLGGQGGNDALLAQLEQARAELASVRERYSAEHPDVKRLTSTVKRLEKDLASNRSPPPRVQATQSPTNPAYIELKARLQAADADLRGWRAKRTELQERVKAYEARVMRTPQVERENRALLREYEGALSKYEDIKSKQAEAELGESMEMELKGEQFTLVEPPLLPEQPVKPNRLGLLLLGAVLALAGGVGTAAVAESLDTTIHGRGDVFRALGVAPLAAIPEIVSGAQRRARTRRQFAAVAVGFGLMILGLYLIHTMVMPVDLLWYSVLRNLSV